MLIARQKIVEKIVRNDLGVEFKVVFLVYEEVGQVKGRIISATPLECPIGASKSPVLTLSGACKRVLISTVVLEFKRDLIPSPFASLLYWNLNIARGPNQG